MNRFIKKSVSVILLSTILLTTLSVNVKASGSQIDNLLSVASNEAAIQYTQGSDGYTKYGAWYGLPYSEWCAMFVSWCAYQAGISTDVIPKFASCASGADWFKSHGRWNDRSGYIPKRGDIIFFDYGQGIHHVGIVESVDSTNRKVTIIEGNSKYNSIGQVQRNTISFDYIYNGVLAIAGYGSPNYSGLPSSDTAPTLNSPSDDVTIQLGVSTNFSWSDIGAPRYQITFTNPAGSASDIYTSQTNYNFSPNTTGTWHWKVRKNADTGVTGPWSTERSFTVPGSEPPPSPPGNIRVNYFSGIDLTGNVIWSENVDSINKNWGNGGPGNSVPNDNFSARFTQQALFSEGWYKFHYEVDDAIKIWVDGDCKVDKWGSHVLNEDSQAIYIGAGTHQIVVEYADYGGEAKIIVNCNATTAPVFPDLIPTSIVYDNSSVCVGRQILLDSGVQNAGAADSQGFNVKWYINGSNVVYDGHCGVSANSTVLNDNSAYYWTPVSSGTYEIKFVVDCDNQVTESNENNNETTVYIYVPEPVPDSPTGLTSPSKTDTTVSLSWLAVSGTAGYNIYNGNSKVNVTPIYSTNYTVTNLTPNSTYTFTITAVNAVGESLPSGSITVTTNAAVPLSYEASINGAVANAGDMLLYSFVTGASGDYTIKSSGDFDVYGCLYSSNFSLIAQDDDSGGNAQFLITQSLANSQEYYVLVRAYSSTATGNYILNVSGPSLVNITPVNYTVSFDSQGGSTVSNINAAYNSQITEPVPPTRAGYTFGGWFKEPNCTNRWDFSTDKVYSDTILYAKWIYRTFTYETNGSCATITAYLETGENVVIPSSIDGYTVTGIGDYAFYNCTALTSITVPDSVTSIGYAAFCNCTNLSNAALGNNIASIGNYAFYNCGALKNITIPGTVQDWGGAFRESGIENVTIASGAASIPAYAFENCTSLKSVSIPEGVTNIVECAFSGCTSLTSVVIPNTVKDIWYDAFSDCTSLCSLTIGSSVTNIDDYAFCNCTALTSIEIPNSVSSIGYAVFSNCSNLNNVTIGDGVASIGNYTFYNCGALKNITIPGTVQDWGGAFRGSGLASVTIASGVTSIPAYAFENCTSLKSVSIPEGVTNIVECAFSGCTSLTSVVLPNTVKDIWYDAFFDCTSLCSLTIGSSVTNIDDYAFYNCTALTSVEIPNSVSSIGYAVFSNCSNLNNVTIGNGITSIGNYAFYNCGALKNITIPGTVQDWDGAFRGSGLENVTIASGAASIPAYAFENCTSLKSVFIPTGVADVLECAFSGCTSLTSVVIPNTVKDIWYDAFSGCTSLCSLVIGNSVTNIYSYAFFNCSSLTTITIPKSVTSIGLYAFEYCSSLTSFNVGTDNANYSSTDGVLFNKDKTALIQYPAANTAATYNIPDGVTSIGYSSFEFCGNLTAITLSNSVTSICDWAFSCSSNLTSVTIPDNVIEIGSYAFAGCDKLTIYGIPGSYAQTYAVNNSIPFKPIPANKDINNDGIIDVLDIAELASHYEEKIGQMNWNTKYDINQDGIVNIYDLVLVSTQIGA